MKTPLALAPKLGFSYSITNIAMAICPKRDSFRKIVMNKLNGIMLMIVAMAGFALEDLFVKQLSSTIPTAQILIILGFCSSIVFAFMAHAKGHSIFAAHVWTRKTMARAAAEAIAAVAFVTSLSLVPISTVAAVFQVTPLVITMGAAMFLGEQVGWRRWTAIIVGLIGVLIIIRPGLSGFDPFVLFVLISVLGVTARDLITRSIPENIGATVISFQAFVSLIFAGTILLFLNSDTLVAVSKLEAAYFAGGVCLWGRGDRDVAVCLGHARILADAESNLGIRNPAAGGVHAVQAGLLAGSDPAALYRKPTRKSVRGCRKCAIDRGADLRGERTGFRYGRDHVNDPAGADE